MPINVFPTLQSQPPTQALSSLPPLVVGRKTLIAVGHVTTQNLGGKKICWAGRGGRVFWLLLWQTLWVSKPRAVAKNYSLYRGLMCNFTEEECHIISAISKTYWEGFRSQRNSAAEWSSNFSTVNACKMLHTESRWNQWISLLNLWIWR